MASRIKIELEKYAKAEEIDTAIVEKGKWKKITLEKFEDLLLERYGGILRKFRKPIIINFVAFLLFGIPFVIVYLPKLTV